MINTIPRLLCLLLILPSVLQSNAADCKKGKTYAIVVGIATYKYSSINLKFCDDDARDFHQVIAKDNPPDQVILLTNEEATATNIQKKMEYLFNKAKEDDRIVFFFSGHGNSDYFIPYDGLPGKSVLPFSAIKKAYRDSKAGQKFLIADACKSGSVRNKENQQNAVIKSEKSFSKEEIVVFTSSRTDQLSIEFAALRHGLFTYYILKGIDGAADDDGDKVITVKELYNYTRQQMITLTNGAQVPVMWGRFDGSMPFVCN